MTQNFRCGDQAALVGYLYDDCEPLEREAIAAHVISCPACAEEVAMLAATRRQLATWTPPEAQLGFRITPATANDNVLAFRPADPGARDGSRWRQPLPAWAQVAAAAVIFVSGLAVGMARGEARAASAANEKLVGLDHRIAGLEMAQRRPVTVSAPQLPESASRSAVLLSLDRVREEIQKSKAEQEQGFQAEMASMGIEVLRDARTYMNERFEREQRMRVGLIQTSAPDPQE
jgi:putative zinc finger protein